MFGYYYGTKIFSPVATYHTAQNFDGGDFDVFDTFQLDRQNFTRQLFKNNTVFTGIW